MKNRELVGKLAFYENNIYKITEKIVVKTENNINNYLYVLEKLNKETDSTNGVVAYREDFILFNKEDYKNLNLHKKKKKELALG